MTLPMPWFARLAHDLRGPLTPLQTAAYLLKSGQIDAAQQQELFALIDRQTRVMGSMIDELGDWSQANRGTLLGHMAPCEVSMLLEIAIGSFASSNAASPSILDETGGANVICDQVRLVEAFRSLMGYAMSRRSDKPPALHAHTIDGMLRLDIVVDGLATDAAEIADSDTLFDQPLTHAYDGGLGLKLLLARAIVVAHSGSLGAESPSAASLRIRCDLPVATET
ncbi:MAG: histidine kinase dimerization/phospho-acceptor domain-containing protein [Luteimonas sp.]